VYLFAPTENAAAGAEWGGGASDAAAAAAPIFKFTFHKQSARADRLPFRSSEQAKYKTANPISQAINPLKNDASVAQLRAVFDSDEMKPTERLLAHNKQTQKMLAASFCRWERMKENKKKRRKLCVCNFLWKCWERTHSGAWDRNNWGVPELLFMADANKMRGRKNKLQTCMKILCLVCSWEPFNYSRRVH
jgi:hypothetical protein